MKRLTLALGIIITMALTVMAQGVDGIKRNSTTFTVRAEE